MRHHDNNERLVTKVIMSTKSGSETEKLISVDEELKLFYKGAFDDFDWNKNGRIACGVIITSHAHSFVKMFLRIFSMRCEEPDRIRQSQRPRTWSTKLMTALQVSILRLRNKA